MHSTTRREIPSGVTTPALSRRRLGRSAKLGAIGLMVSGLAAGGGVLVASASSSSGALPSAALSPTAQSLQAQKLLGTNAEGVQQQLNRSSQQFDSQSPVSSQTYSHAEWETLYQNRLNLANCMHQKGFTTWPDPTPAYGTGQVPALGVGGPTEPKVDAATPGTVAKDEGACLANAPSVTAST